MNIFFTGHRGFLGRELIPHISKTHNVYTEYFDYCNSNLVQNVVKAHNIDFIIHAAIRGGRRVREDTGDDFYNNILMFENLANTNLPMINFCSGAAYGRESSIDGPTEYEIGKVIPKDYYGLSKFLISKRCSQLSNVKNLRFFNVFGPQETEDRFIKTNIKNYINNKSIIVFKDKYMDFFGINDTKTVVDFYINNFNDSMTPPTVNLVYDNKLSLTDIGMYINTLSEHNVNIVTNSDDWDNNYYGSGNTLRDLNLNLNGIMEEIKNCYNYIK